MIARKWHARAANEKRCTTHFPAEPRSRGQLRLHQLRDHPESWPNHIQMGPLTMSN